MASEIHGDLASIHDEDLLRRMWQQSEDFGLKKEIRTHMYKVREERLRNFYSTGIMDSSGLRPTKMPLTPSHGESLADHSFQSLKAKEIRDSESPSRDFRISHTGIVAPDTSGWNIVTSSETSPDGRARKTESTATTEGVQQLPGGHSEFAGKNKHMTKMLHEGDDQNYTKRADESSATQFHERIVVGDENSGRTETKSSSTTSSSHVSTSKFSSTTNNPPHAITDQPNIPRGFDDNVDAIQSSPRYPQPQMHPNYPEHHQRTQNERYTSDDSTNIRQITNRREIDEINKTEKQNIQKEVDLLAAQPGVLISRSVDYPDPNTKVITETKQLPDGTTVTTRKYETKSASSKTFRSSSNQQHSTSSRTVVEDRTQKNQIEYIDDREAERIRQQQQQQLRTQPNKAIHNVETNEEVQTTTSRRSSVQNIDRTDKSVRKENLKNQVENIFIDDQTHRTVKKDLSQKYRAQDFIDHERGYSPEPEKIHPSQRSNNTRVDKTTTSHETTTVTENVRQSTPAAGKPSYNVQKISSPRQASMTPERSTPTRDSCSPPYSDKPYHQPQEYEIPIDTSGYPSNKVPPNTYPRSNEREPSPCTKIPQSTPAAGKPSYSSPPSAGKPSYTKSVHETQKTSKDIRETHTERVQTSPQREPQYPSSQPYHSPKDQSSSTPQERQIPVSYEPRDRQPYSPTRPDTQRDSPKPQGREVTTTITTTTTRSQQPSSNEPAHPYGDSSKPKEREIRVSRPSEPDGRQVNRRPIEKGNDNRPYSTDRTPKSQQRETTTTTVTRTYQPDDQEPRYPTADQNRPHEPNERYITVTRPTQPDEFESMPAAGKPSYTHQPTLAAGKPSYTAPPPNEPYRAPSEEPSPKRPSSSQPAERQYPAGKPSYTAPRADDSSPNQPSSRGSPRDEPRNLIPRDTYPQEMQYEPRGSPDRPIYRDQDRPQFTRRPSEESRISTDTVRTNNTYITNKISVEVDAAHDTFARSLRCVSPSDRGSVKSLRTSTTSVRSSPHSDKRSPRGRRPQRSPSRDSITYSESSRISTSTVTKEKPNTPKDRSPKKPADKPSTEQRAKIKHQPTKRPTLKDSFHPTDENTSPTKPSRSSNQPDQSSPSKRPDVYRSNETIDLTTTRKDSTHHITTIVKEIEEFPGENQSPSKQSPSKQTKPGQTTPKHQTSPKSQVVITRNTTKNKPSQSQPTTSKPSSKRVPQKQTPSSVIGKPRQPVKPETVKITPKSMVVTNINRTTHSGITKTNKEPKRSPQQLVKNSYPDTPKASKSPRSSPERSSRPAVQPSRPSGQMPRQPERQDTPDRPAAGKPSDKGPTVTTKFTKTIQVNNTTLRQDNPSTRGPRKPKKECPQGSDDEGFEPESPRSSSPTSSVSDLVYHKGVPEQHDGSILTTNRKIKTDKFIKTERRDVETIENIDKTVIVDDSTYNRRNKKSPSPSPERPQARRNEQLPRDDDNSEPNYSEEEFPEGDTPKRYPKSQQPDSKYYPEREPNQHQRYHSTSPDRDQPLNDLLRSRYPNGEPKIGPFIPPSDTDESYEPSVTSKPRGGSPVAQIIESTDEEKPREPFYLIQPRPSDEEDAKHPKTPKTHPKITRSETYEERCRKILGMDRQIKTTEDTTETVVTRKSPTRGANDFITVEQTVEEKNRSPKQKGSPYRDSPSKTIPGQQEPAKKTEKPYKQPSKAYHSQSQDETSPDDTETYQIEETTEVVTKSYKKPREPSPGKTYPDNQKITGSSPRRSPDSSPNRNQSFKTTTHSNRQLVERSENRESVTKTRKQPRQPNPEKIQRRPADSPTRRSPDLSPNRRGEYPTRSSPDSSPNRKQTTKTPLRPGKRPVGRSPERESVLKAYKQPREPAPGKKYPDDQNRRVNSPRRPSPETSPQRKQPNKPSGRNQYDQSPDSSPTRQYGTSSPTRSPTRKPQLDNSSPIRKSIKPKSYDDEKSPSRDEKIPSYRSRSPSSPTRKPISSLKPALQSPSKPEKFTADLPSRRKPVETSPTRRPEMSPTRTNKMPADIRQSPQKQKPVRDTSPGRKPHKNEPYPTDKYCENGEIVVVTTTKTIRSSPSRTSPQSKSPTRKSPTHRVPDDVTSGKLTNRYSPKRSPVRQSPKDTYDSSPTKRTAQQSPSRRPAETKPDNKQVQRPSGRVPSRSPSPRAKYTETVTIVTETRTKESPVPQKGKQKPTEPEPRPSHVTTAKIHLSPPAERKSSSIAVKKSPKTPNSTTTQAAKTPREDTTTFKTPKSTVPRSAPTQRTEEKLVSTKRKEISTEESRVEEKIQTRKRPENESEEVESEPEEEDSDVISDAEDVTTVIEATTTTVKRIPEKGYPNKKYPLTERKDSAPVYRTTNVEKDKMVRSTSENLIKTKIQRPNPDIDSPLERDSPRRKSLDKKRPIKCMATKTITITGSENLINSEDMENVIIDIQQAKSSREPSPNRIVPTPVRPGEDTGIPRYPDTVQEPEDETRRRPKVKDIPIFEEDTKDYVRCHISEVEQDEIVERRSSVRRREDEEYDEIVTSVTKRGRPASPDYSHPRSQPSETDDDYRLTVHDKVAKFISTAEEVKKPKPSAPFSREPRSSDTEPDDCLLSVNEKVSKFLTTAEKISKPSRPSGSTQRPQRPDLDDVDDELKNDESILSVSEKVTKFTSTIDKLVEDTPQRSPKLVANIERQVSRKDEYPDDSDQEDSAPTEPVEPMKRKDPLDEKLPTRISIKDRYQPDRPSSNKKPISTKPVLPKSTEVVKKAKSVFENKDTSKPKQRDILSRPSVWEHKRNPSEVKLEDIGVHKPFDDETEEIIKRERSRSRSPGESENEPVEPSTRRTHRISDVSSSTVSSRKHIYERHVTSKSSSPRTPVRKEDTPTPRSQYPENQQSSDLKRPDTRHPNESGPRMSPNEPDGKYPTRSRYPNRHPDDDEFIEEVTETTTTTRSERRSPSRRCEYYSPERESASPARNKDPSPTRTHSGKVKQYPTSEPTSRGDHHTLDSSPRKYSRQADENVTVSMKVTSKVDQTKTAVTRKPSDSSPVKTYPSGKPISTTPGHRPSYMEPTVSSIEHRRDSTEIVKHSHPHYHSPDEPADLHRVPSHEEPDQSTPIGNVPSYMEHTISSMEHRRDSVEINKTHSKRTSHDSLYNEPSPRSAKFGVELKRTDVHDSTTRRKSSSSEIPNIEEIFDLELLEKMLETVVGYEHRRRIRAQIRIVRKMIEEGTLEKNTTTITTTKTIVRKESGHSPIRKAETHVVRRTDTSPDGRVTTSKRTPLGPKDPKSATNQLIDSESRHITHHEKKSMVRDRSISPQGKVRTTTTTTEVRRVGDKPVVKKTITQKEEKPIWATKNILKKPSENDRLPSVKRTTTSKTQRQIITKDDADCITSSYGIGPTDEDGKPLFGIRALKKKPQQSGETHKITGSIVTESYYSENGAPPVGERQVTVYSNNPEDIDDYEQIKPEPKSGIITKERTSKDGITSVTRVQKIGKQQKEITSPELPAITDGKTTTKQVKMVRKGSVKEMSEKFTKKGSTTSVTEKTTSGSYPKAGLILRTQNYSSTENEDPVEECNIEIHTTRKQSRQMYTESDSETEQRRVTKTTKTFLNSNGEKITGVEDVLNRMRNADNVTEDGDTPDDREARSLLNKFLGASVLMSGVESMVPKEVVTRTIVDSPSKHEVRTTRVTKTITSGGNSSSPVARKTCDIEEIWDEEYLKQLLEQSTNYEERRRIRAQIRRIMAEKQACTEIATNIKAERKTEQQNKAEIITKTQKKVVIETEENEESDTESEYEEVEVVEEVTDDSSAEGEEEDEEEEAAEEEEVEKQEEKSTEKKESVEVEEESDEESAEEEKPVKPSISKPNEEVKAEVTPESEDNSKPETSNQTTATKTKVDEDQLSKEEAAKEQKGGTTETRETKEKDGAVVTTTTKVTTRTIAAAPKPVSPFAKFRQLDKQNSQNSPNSPSSPMTPGGTNRGAPLFQFTDPALCARAATVKEQLLQWCQMKTKEYENVQITNFSTSWSDGLAFCALIHHFLPDAFDYSKLTPKERRHNFELAFRVADEKADIAPLLDVEDMVVMRKPDWKCVFTYVQSIFRRFRNCS